jgi:hypothetical protein
MAGPTVPRTLGVVGQVTRTTFTVSIASAAAEASSHPGAAPPEGDIAFRAAVVAPFPARALDMSARAATP